MRSDASQPTEDFRRSSEWQFNALSGEVQPDITSRYQLGKQEVEGRLQWHSFSGNERNRLFLNQRGQRFRDVSALSGLDNIADSRAFVLWDYDRDGWQDIAMVNANRPLLNIYRNQIQRRASEGTAPIVALRFVGGNDKAISSSEFGPRDGYGARVTVRAGDLTVTREHRCGEGFAAQNSDTMIVGIGEHAQADRLTVSWPSGKTQSIDDVAAGSLLDVYEDPMSSPGGRGFVQHPYGEGESPSGQQVTGRGSIPFTLVLDAPEVKADPAKLQIYTTMATWCVACKAHLPQLARLRNAIPNDQVSMFGVPMDGIESPQELTEYVQEQQPAYRLLVDLSAKDRSRVQKAILRALDTESLPTTIITDRNGKVLEVVAGVPTVSAVRRALFSRASNQDAR